MSAVTMLHDIARGEEGGRCARRHRLKHCWHTAAWRENHRRRTWRWTKHNACLFTQKDAPRVAAACLPRHFVLRLPENRLRAWLPQYHSFSSCRAFATMAGYALSPVRAKFCGSDAAWRCSRLFPPTHGIVHAHVAAPLCAPAAHHSTAYRANSRALPAASPVLATAYYTLVLTITARLWRQGLF